MSIRSRSIVFRAALLTALSCPLFTGCRDSRQEKAPVPTASVAPVMRGDLSSTLAVAGEFQPYQEVDLHAKVSGYIRRINFRGVPNHCRVQLPSHHGSFWFCLSAIGVRYWLGEYAPGNKTGHLILIFLIFDKVGLKQAIALILSKMDRIEMHRNVDRTRLSAVCKCVSECSRLLAQAELPKAAGALKGRMYELHRDIDRNLHLYCNLRHLLCNPKGGLFELEHWQLESPRLHFVTRREFASLAKSTHDQVLFQLESSQLIQKHAKSSLQGVGITVEELEKCIAWIPGDSSIFVSSPDGFSPSLLRKLKRLRTRRELFLIRELSDNLGAIEKAEAHVL
jgi:hypothetical protein